MRSIAAAVVSLCVLGVLALLGEVPGGGFVQSAGAQSVCVGGVCVNNGRVRVYRRKNRTYRSRRRIRTPSQPRWVSGIAGSKQYASNSYGLTITYDDAGEIILQIEIKHPVPNIRPGQQIPVSLNFGRRGNYAATGVVGQTGTTLIVSGAIVYSIIGSMKSGSKAHVMFIANDYWVRLSGSGKAIEQVELSAQQWKLLSKDRIDDAGKEHAKADIAKRPQSQADTLKAADDTNKDVQPKAGLRDGRRKVSDLRVQYFVPGTREIGEMWVNWDVDDKGLFVGLNFIDPKHKTNTPAHAIRMPFERGSSACAQDLNTQSEVLTLGCKFVRALLKANSWQQALEEKKYRKPITKTIDYIVGNQDSDKSLSVVFRRYEDGVYAVQIDDRKFGVSKLFNFTIDNGLDLARITQDAVNEANQGTISEADLDDILR